jgi:hypothetical protein
MAGKQTLHGFASATFKTNQKQGFACSIAAKMGVAAASVRITGVKDTIRAKPKQCWFCSGEQNLFSSACLISDRLVSSNSLQVTLRDHKLRVFDNQAAFTFLIKWRRKQS